jgi:hypothetical protein
MFNIVLPGVPPGVPPPHDGVLLVATGCYWLRRELRFIGCAWCYWYNKKDLVLVLIFFIFVFLFLFFVFFIFASLFLVLG